MNRIKELRTEEGLSLEALANKINISLPEATTTSKMQLSRYERGESEPPSDVWYRLANYFDVTVPYLMGFSEIKRDLDFSELSSLLDDYSKKENKDIDFSCVMNNVLSLIKSLQKVGGIDNNLDIGDILEILLAITTHITSNNSGFDDINLTAQSDVRLFELIGKLNIKTNSYIEGLMDATNISIYESFQEGKLEEIPVRIFNMYNQHNFIFPKPKINETVTHEDVKRALKSLSETISSQEKN